ncbi:MAG: PAS domain S-box protein [Deltaproteobacteria bacterium]|nr:PAS domain S-box protein [Deltaproteobacteria bacterium]
MKNGRKIQHPENTAQGPLEPGIQLRDLADKAPTGIWVVQNGMIKYGNLRLAAIFGYEPNDLIGMDIENILSSDDISLVSENLRKVTEEGSETIHVEFRGITHSGKVVYLDLYGSAITYEGKPAVIGMMTDITATKEMEKALKESEQRFRFLAENMKDIFWLVDYDTGKIQYLSPVVEKYLMYTAEELTEMPPESIITPESLAKALEYMSRAVEAAERGIRFEVETFEMEAIRKDGMHIWFETSYSLNYDENGHIVSAQGVSRDITERKKFEKTLQESEKRYRRLASNVTDLVVEWEENPFKAAYVTPSAERLFGYSNDDLKHITLEKVISPKYQNKLREFVTRMNEALKADPSYIPPPIETPVICKDGSIVWIELTFSFTRDEAGNVVSGMTVNRDITERKKAEQELAKRTAELARSNAELEQFAYIASHDLQEPLRMVAGFTELLARRYKGKLDSEADEFINFAVDGATRMQHLINDLLTYSRVGTREDPFSSADCRTVLENASANLAVAIEENRAVIKSGNLPVVMGDAGQLMQLFQNLIANAVKFRSEKPPVIDISVQKQGGEWVFSVSDNGIGIDPQYHESIFAVFQRTPTGKSYAGTGIGLAICKKIVERHGGRIWVTSEPGAGSTFYFTIPG